MKLTTYNCKTLGGRNKTIADGIRKILENEKTELLVTPEFTNIDLEQQIELSQIQPEALVILGTSPTYTNNYVYNTSRAIQNGKVISQYDKRSFVARQTKYWEANNFDLKGKKIMKGLSNGLFEYDGKKLGIEICADHTRGLGTDKNHLPVLKTTHGHKLDLQIILSCGLKWISNEGLAINKKGYAVLVDGANKRSFVRSIDSKIKGKGKYILRHGDDFRANYDLPIRVATHPQA